jgi:hypothetical protein
VAQVIWLIALGGCVWVYFDARELGVRKGGLGGGGLDMSVRSWVICCAVIPLIAFPAYLMARSRYRGLADTAGTPWPIETWGATPTAFVPAQAQPVQHVAPPQLSADGHWWWNGAQWVPATGAGSAAG